MNENKLFPLKKTIVAFAVLSGLAGAFPLASHLMPQTHAASAAVAGLPDFTELVDKVGPAVVNIRTTEKIQAGNGFAEEDPALEFFRRFWGMPVPKAAPKKRSTPQHEEEIPRGVGSGFIVSADGYVLTNAHVIEGASEVYVKLTDKREFKAKVVGRDAKTDVAVLKIEAKNLPKVNVGDSSKVRAGEWVIAIGSPFDLENTVTAGIVSAKARDTGDFVPLIQTDVAVNPGNSGGPLINMRGEVIGINSQIYSRSGGYMGISFAIPIDEAIRVSEQIKAGGKVSRGRLGVRIAELSKDIAEQMGLPKVQGVVIAQVEPGSPAEKAGLRDGDVVLKFNGQVIEKPVDLTRAVGALKPDTKANISVWRNGAQREVALVIGEAETDKTAQKADKKSKKEVANSLGLTVTDLSEAQKRDLQSGGVVVEAVDGAAAAAGIMPGDYILSLNQLEVKDAKQFAAIVAKLDPKKAAVVLVRRDRVSQFVLLKPQQ